MMDVLCTTSLWEEGLKPDNYCKIGFSAVRNFCLKTLRVLQIFHSKAASVVRNNACVDTVMKTCVCSIFILVSNSTYKSYAYTSISIKLLQSAWSSIPSACLL